MRHARQARGALLFSEGIAGKVAFIALAPIPFAWLTVFILVHAFRAARIGFRAVVPWQSLNSWKKGFVVLCGVFSEGALLFGCLVVMNLYVDKEVPVVMGRKMVTSTGSDMVTVSGTWTRASRDEGSAVAYSLTRAYYAASGGELNPERLNVELQAREPRVESAPFA